MPYRPAGVDPFYVPNAPGGVVGENGPELLRGHYLRWLDASRQANIIGWTRSFGPRPSYKIISGKTANDTVKIAEQLGLPADYVDKKNNRIYYSELVLAAIPVEEYHRRVSEGIKRQRADRQDQDEAYFEELAKNPHIKPLIMQIGELAERKAHAEREGQPFASLAQTNRTVPTNPSGAS